MTPAAVLPYAAAVLVGLLLRRRTAYALGVAAGLVWGFVVTAHRDGPRAAVQAARIVARNWRSS